ncbi:MAG: hypothetical protein DRI23_13010 [Candidatus Cloacimonadota bacterium]|nr:MAG: hypothetical protein DRI23_13010 [Candidatus Cloacimonadota bacterium]
MKNSNCYSQLERESYCSGRSSVGLIMDSAMRYHYNDIFKIPRPTTKPKMTRVRDFLLIIILFFSYQLIASETETPDTLKTRRYVLEGIRVIAEKPQEAIGSIEVKEFNPQISMPEVNVSETLEDVSGLDLSTGGKSGTEVSIRGFANDEIKFMLDGRPLGGGYFGNVDLNTIPVSEIKEIQIIKGPVSSLYGSDTMGGVINIITRSPANDSWFKAGALFRRNNTNKTYLSSSHDFGIWDYWLYASHNHTDGFMLSKDFQATTYENGAVRNNTLRDQWDFQSKFNFTLFDFHSIGIQIGYTFMDDKEIPASIYENQLRKFLDWERFQLSAVGFFQLSDFITSDVNVYYDQYDDTYAEYNTVTGEMFSTWPSYLESWIFGVNNKYDWQISRNLKSIAGYRFEKQVYNRKDNGSYPDWTSNNQLMHNGFIQTEYLLGSFTISTGSGISWFRQKDRKKWIHHLEPSAGIYWKKGFKASLAYSSNTKYPNLHELFSNSSGNEDLTEQKAQKMELALEIPYNFNTIYGSFSPAFFYNQVNGLIEKQNDQYKNVGNVDSYGLELEGKLHFITEHQVSFSYIEYSNEENFSLLGIPQNSVSISEKYTLPWDIKMHYKAAWKDIRNFQEDNLQIILPPYWLHSVYWNKSWKNYKFMFGLENIFDKDYQERYGYPGEGFNFVVSVEAEF